jgi:hypothetical protein
MPILKMKGAGGGMAQTAESYLMKFAVSRKDVAQMHCILRGSIYNARGRQDASSEMEGLLTSCLSSMDVGVGGKV